MAAWAGTAAAIPAALGREQAYAHGSLGETPADWARLAVRVGMGTHMGLLRSWFGGTTATGLVIAEGGHGVAGLGAPVALTDSVGVGGSVEGAGADDETDGDGPGGSDGPAGGPAETERVAPGPCGRCGRLRGRGGAG